MPCSGQKQNGILMCIAITGHYLFNYTNALKCNNSALNYLDGFHK